MGSPIADLFHLCAVLINGGPDRRYHGGLARDRVGFAPHKSPRFRAYMGSAVEVSVAFLRGGSVAETRKLCHFAVTNRTGFPA
jgi:hypothetical protein